MLRLRPAAAGNLLAGEVVALDATGLTVYGQSDKIVLLLGVEDLVVWILKTRCWCAPRGRRSR